MLLVSGPESIERGRRALLDALVVAYPTETSYGLAVDAASLEAVEALRRLKGRDARQGISLIVADLAMAQRVAVFCPVAEGLASMHWPGPLTLVLPLGDRRYAAVSDAGTVAVRVSADPVALALCRALGRPITATSANPQGGRPATLAGEADLPGVALVLDDGPRASPPSTIAAVEAGQVRVLRQGELRL